MNNAQNCKNFEKITKKCIYYVYKTKEKWYNGDIGGYKGDMRKMNIMKKAMTAVLVFCLSLIIFTSNVQAVSTTIRASASKVAVRKDSFRNC